MCHGAFGAVKEAVAGGCPAWRAPGRGPTEFVIYFAIPVSHCVVISPHHHLAPARRRRNNLKPFHYAVTRQWTLEMSCASQRGGRPAGDSF
jgi:hypothetical protein